MSDEEAPQPKIVVSEHGPYLITGPIEVTYQVIATDDDGASWTWKTGDTVPVTPKFAFCRCGHSSNKPFCDGSHRKQGAAGESTASFASYEEQAKIYDGPSMQMGDAEALCALARFCDGKGSAWRLVAKTADQEARELLAHETTHCPSGRLVAYDKESLGAAVEAGSTPSIGIIEDPTKGVSGGYWVRGGVRIETFDGKVYPTRERVVLCRCGHSSNKPFCDGSHAKAKFADDVLEHVTASADGSDAVDTPEV